MNANGCLSRAWRWNQGLGTLNPWYTNFPMSLPTLVPKPSNIDTRVFHSWYLKRQLSFGTSIWVAELGYPNRQSFLSTSSWAAFNWIAANGQRLPFLPPCFLHLCFLLGLPPSSLPTHQCLRAKSWSFLLGYLTPKTP